jgi:hypothetical protein
MLEAITPTFAKPLQDFFPAASDEGLDLINKLL